MIKKFEAGLRSMKAWTRIERLATIPGVTWLAKQPVMTSMAGKIDQHPVRVASVLVSSSYLLAGLVLLALMMPSGRPVQASPSANGTARSGDQFAVVDADVIEGADGSRMVRFGRFGMGSLPEAITSEFHTIDPPNPLSFEEIHDCLIVQETIVSQRQGIVAARSTIERVDLRLDSLEHSVNVERAVLENRTPTPQAVARANEAIARYNDALTQRNELVESFRYLEANLEMVIGPFSVNCTDRPFAIEDEERARRALRETEASTPVYKYSTPDSPWPALTLSGRG